DLGNGTTIEIGPGPGGLTRALLIEGAVRVIGIERDDRAIAALGERVVAGMGRLVLQATDALELDIAGLGPPPLRIVANLPYNISTALFICRLRRSDPLGAS